VPEFCERTGSGPVLEELAESEERLATKAKERVGDRGQVQNHAGNGKDGRECGKSIHSDQSANVSEISRNKCRAQPESGAPVLAKTARKAEDAGELTTSAEHSRKLNYKAKKRVARFRRWQEKESIEAAEFTSMSRGKSESQCHLQFARKIPEW